MSEERVLLDTRFLFAFCTSLLSSSLLLSPNQYLVTPSSLLPHSLPLSLSLSVAWRQSQHIFEVRFVQKRIDARNPRD